MEYEIFLENYESTEKNILLFSKSFVQVWNSHGVWIEACEQFHTWFINDFEIHMCEFELNAVRMKTFDLWASYMYSYMCHTQTECERLKFFCFKPQG